MVVEVSVMKRRFLAVSLALVLALSLVTTSGCALVARVEKSTSPTETTSTVNATTSPVQIPVSTNAGQPLPNVADVVALVRPSVVQINTETTYNSYFGQGTQAGAGSGWILRSDGYIITNNHVIDGASKVTVVLEDGTALDVDTSKIAADPMSDIAVLKVNATGLPAVKVGNSDKLRVGDWVVAIGNSLGEGIRATMGIISLQNATVQDPSGTGQDLYGMLETDAAINPGNSGGPLVNMAGEVIGITNAKISAVGVEGTGFAISSNEAVPIIQQLMSLGYVTRPYLGISSYTVDAYAIAQLGLKVDKGVLLTRITTGSPAAKAGLQTYDVVVKFNGQTVSTSSELSNAIYKAKVGQQVEIVFYRGASEMTVMASLVEKPR
jgi:serine protease Do